MSQDIPIEVQLAAFAQAICDVLAVPYAEFQVMRELLDRNGCIAKDEFETAKKDFPQVQFQAIASELKKQVLSKATQIIRQMTKPGRVQ